MTMTGIVGAAVIAALLAATLRTMWPTAATVLTLITGVLLLAAALQAVTPVAEQVTALLERVMLDGKYARVLWKALGIAVLTQTAADVCRDTGENGLAGKVELCGQVLLLVSGLPLFEYVITLLERILSGQAVM